MDSHPHLANQTTSHSHLCRLTNVWARDPIYFITICVSQRRQLLANPAACSILREEWADMKTRHGWMVGRYVVMPDHVHYFVAAIQGTASPLHTAIGKWKEWTSKRLLRTCGGVAPLWQREFFDHVLRTTESRSEKWRYVRENPVRAGLVACAEDWPYTGAIDFE
jgi:putative transposase